MKKLKILRNAGDIMFSHISGVEIAFHSQCNRKCEWCPNKYIDRTFYKEFDEDIFLKLLSDLKENGFGEKDSSTISISRFHEAFINPELARKRSKQIKKILPDVHLLIKSNGDFITKENIKDIPFDRLNIMDYDGVGSARCLIKINDIGFNFDFIRAKNSYIRARDENSRIIIYKSNWKRNVELEDRAGLLDPNSINDMEWINKDKKRNRLCGEPFNTIIVDYDGSVMPCCHMRHDAKEHQEFILGNLHEKSIVEIYKSEKAKKIMKKFEKIKTMPGVCTYCHKPEGGNK
jgi:radical SAM protein with 4Fe4S-binding SPASM domain